jgi:endonuclease YncB( thermonuclease family)
MVWNVPAKDRDEPLLNTAASHIRDGFFASSCICLRRIHRPRGLRPRRGHHRSPAQSKPERVRLSGIDFPEKGQAYGNRAKQAASALVFGRDVILQTHGQDKYGRTLADVILRDGTNVNHELVKDGWCWWYRKYAPGDTVLEGAREGSTRRQEGAVG